MGTAPVPLPTSRRQTHIDPFFLDVRSPAAAHTAQHSPEALCHVIDNIYLKNFSFIRGYNIHLEISGSQLKVQVIKIGLKLYFCTQNYILTVESKCLARSSPILNLAGD